MNTILRAETAGQFAGVPGRFFNVIGDTAATVLANQRFTTERRDIRQDGRKVRVQAEIRFDDSCRNGHNRFAVTGTLWGIEKRGAASVWVETGGGCCHDEIAQAFPELVPFIAFHLMSADGPMHYIANTVYHAGDRDHNGLRKGEARQIRNGKTGLPAWKLVTVDLDGNEVDSVEKYPDAETQPACPYRLEYRAWNRIGEGKARDLEAARSCAIWPEATDAELCAEPAELKAALEARAPALLARFRALVTAAGFLWSPADIAAQVPA